MRRRAFRRRRVVLVSVLVVVRERSRVTWLMGLQTTINMGEEAAGGMVDVFCDHCVVMRVDDL